MLLKHLSTVKPAHFLVQTQKGHEYIHNSLLFNILLGLDITIFILLNKLTSLKFNSFISKNSFPGLGKNFAISPQDVWGY